MKKGKSPRTNALSDKGLGAQAGWHFGLSSKRHPRVMDFPRRGVRQGAVTI